MSKRRLHFSGPVLTASGYGVHARQLLKAIHETGMFDIQVDSLRWGETPFLNDADLQWIRDLAAKPAHANPEISVQVTIPIEFRRKAPITIGVTAGIEVDRVSPRWILACNEQVDVVVVPSEHSRTSFMVEYSSQDGRKVHLEKPLFVIHEGVDTAVYRPQPAPSKILDDLGVPAKNFIFCGLGLDKPQGRDRKNVSRLVEYFCKTFAGNKGVGLVLKAAIVNGSAVDFEILRRRISDIKLGTGCGEYPKVYVVHGRLSEEEMAGLYNDPRITAAISLTHGEGFGLPLIEAAACGLPVMATDWSGHLDFLVREGKKLFVPIEQELQEVPPESVWEGVIEAGTRWAVPKEADACTKMQKMALSSTTPRKWAADLAEWIAGRFNLAATGGAFVDLLKQALTELDRATASGAVGGNGMREAVKAKGPSLIYTMPMSTGDVFLSTGVVRSLRRRHPGHRVYFATSPQYFDIVKDLIDPDDGKLLVDEVITWQPWMQDVGQLEDTFDEVYTPNLAVQMTWSNWVHRGKGRNLIDEFAAQCGVTALSPLLPDPDRNRISPENLPPAETMEGWIAIHAGGQKSARAWAHWTDLVKNLRAQGMKVVQVGAPDDITVGEVDRDLRGKTNHATLVSCLRSCKTFFGIDSYPMHVAATVGCRVVAMFGSSYGHTTGPKNFRLPVLSDFSELVSKQTIMEEVGRITCIDTPDRNGCERACYKDVCKVDPQNPCLNNITARSAFVALGFDEKDFKEHRPKIGGYIHILNPKTHGYPYIQSIESMLGFCDEVVAVDGGSTDESVDLLRASHACHMALISGQLRVITQPWDPEEPGMDGMQKAFGRAMVSPEMEFLWQQDADEIVHEDDYAKIVDVCKRFPPDCDLVHLPVIELWGDDRHARTDRHSWKWRLSRNNIRITHGINVHARQVDPKTGRIFSKPGMSDGCEYIDMVSGDHLPHRGFYTPTLEEIRQRDPEQYGRIMNEVYSKLPSVWHYSWADLPRKVRNFRDFWDKQWQVLYQTPAQPRFPDVVTDEDVEKKAEELKTRGGEHGPGHVFELTKNPPACMKGSDA